MESQPTLSRRQVRWVDFLETHFHYDIIYKPGLHNKADALSRPGHVPTNATATAEATARLFFDRIITIHGIPATLISDRDPKFTSKFWKELMGLLGTKLAMSSAYHPQNDGQTERLNQVVEQLLRTACKDDVSHWDTQLPTLEFAYNNASHAATGKTPFFLCYGQEPLTPQQPTTPAHVSKWERAAARRQEEGREEAGAGGRAAAGAAKASTGATAHTAAAPDVEHAAASAVREGTIEGQVMTGREGRCATTRTTATARTASATTTPTSTLAPTPTLAAAWLCCCSGGGRMSKDFSPSGDNPLRNLSRSVMLGDELQVCKLVVVEGRGEALEEVASDGGVRVNDIQRCKAASKVEDAASEGGCAGGGVHGEGPEFLDDRIEGGNVLHVKKVNEQLLQVGGECKTVLVVVVASSNIIVDTLVVLVAQMSAEVVAEGSAIGTDGSAAAGAAAGATAVADAGAIAGAATGAAAGAAVGAATGAVAGAAAGAAAGPAAGAAAGAAADAAAGDVGGGVRGGGRGRLVRRSRAAARWSAAAMGGLSVTTRWLPAAVYGPSGAACATSVAACNSFAEKREWRCSGGKEEGEELQPWESRLKPREGRSGLWVGRSEPREGISGLREGGSKPQEGRSGLREGGPEPREGRLGLREGGSKV
ncbi:unnamed protein product [Closterium sp. NIES-53]